MPVQVSDDSPVLLDSFLSAAIEVDIDAVSDGENVVIGSIMQHIEQAGIHSGDSACSLPPYSLPADVQDDMRDMVKAMAVALEVKGLMNVQLAWQDDQIYVIEVNPRASRTVPFRIKSNWCVASENCGAVYGRPELEVTRVYGRSGCLATSASKRRYCRLTNSPGLIRYWVRR
jgi:carbamoylphosphate synthase large subunit